MSSSPPWFPSLPEFVPRKFRLAAWTDHVPFGYWLVGEFRPECVVELGTHFGESYFSFCQSVQAHRLSTVCYAVDTWKGDPQAGLYGEEVYTEVLAHNAEHYSAFSYLLRSTFDAAAPQFAEGSIDLLHIDGLHSYEAVRHDFETWLPKVREGGIILLHDIAERTGGFGVWKLWQELSREYQTFAFRHGHGLGVLRKGVARASEKPLLKRMFEASGAEAQAIRAHFVLLADHLKATVPAPTRDRRTELEAAVTEKVAQSTDAILLGLREQQATLSRFLEEQKAASANEARRREDELRALRSFSAQQTQAHAEQLQRQREESAAAMAALETEAERLRKQLADVSAAAAAQEESLTKLPEVIAQARAALSRLYTSRRWQLPNLLRARRARQFGQAQATYWPLEEALASLEKWQSEHPRPLHVDAPPTEPPRKPVRRLDLYEAHVRHNSISPALRGLLGRAARNFTYQPTISVLMPVYEIAREWIELAVESVRAQIYPHWELCLADDGSSDPALLDYLRSLGSEPRIKVCFRAENGHICAATNSAADLATGEFIALLDQDDALAPHALFEIASLLQTDREADLIYSDEDKIDVNGRRYDPHFKPDWSPELLLSYNYINHFTCIRRSVFEKVGRFRVGYEGSQDHDLLLRVVTETPRVRHIPKVLYHWRALPSSSAASARDKTAMHQNGRRAVAEHLARLGVAPTLSAPEFAQRLGVPINQLDWPDSGPSVAIIIPVRNKAELLQACVSSIQEKTTYGNYRIVIIDNDSDDPQLLNYLEKLRTKGVEVQKISSNGGGFSFSRLNNLAVQSVGEELVLLLNNDTEVSEPRWLSQLVGHLSLPGVGATGARLLYANDTVQHAGIVLGMRNRLAPAVTFPGHPAQAISYGFFAEVARNYSAVTGACLLVRRDVYLEMGGLDETRFAVSLNDVDFGLRLQARGLRSVYVPSAELRHHESSTRGRRDDPGELAAFRRLYAGVRDPYYNPNHSRTESFGIDPSCHLDYGALLEKPARVLFVSHNLNLSEGAPKAFYELAKGLKERGKFDPVILSPVPGGYAAEFEAAGIPVHVQRLPLNNPDNFLQGWPSAEAYAESVRRVRGRIEQESPALVIANTLHNFHVLEAAAQAGVPCVWIIYESYTREQIAEAAGAFMPQLKRAFLTAARIIFVSTETMKLYEDYDWQRNFCVLNNGLDPAEIDAYIARVSKEEARAEIGAPAGKTIITNVGTICTRKDQGTLLEAARILQRERDDFFCYLVGYREGDPYSEQIKEAVTGSELEKVLTLVPETNGAHRFFRAADIFAFTSLAEGFSFAILEAEAFGLPIVTTHCAGISEQFFDEVNGYVIHMTNPKMLAERLRTLLDDAKLRSRMGANSRKVFHLLPSYADMLGRYEEEFSRAWTQGLVNGSSVDNDGRG